MERMIVILFLLLSSTVMAQQNEDWEERQTDDALSADAQRAQAEEWEYLRTHPVNITHPSYGELLRIPFLSPMLAESIILFTDTVEVDDIAQLSGAALITPQLLERITPFITAEQEGGGWKMVPDKLEFRSRFEDRRERTEGFTDGKYAGSSVASLQRIRTGSAQWEFAAVMEKDAGERWQDGFRSRALELRSIGPVEKLIVGNFAVGASQGLLFARALSAAKGSEAAGQIRLRGSFLSPSVSTDEYRYFDGAAVRLTGSGIALTGVVSERPMPASRDTNGTITSFSSSGLFRTEAEQGKRAAVRERMHGLIGELIIGSRPWLTVAAMNVRYSEDIAPGVLSLSDARSLTMGSAGWDIPISFARTFGELATADLRRFALSSGVMLAFSRDLSVAWHHRSYPKGAASPFARPFGERTDIGDGENGEYIGMEYRSGSITTAAYVDQSVLPSNTGSFNETRRSVMSELLYDIARGTEVSFRYRTSQSTSGEEIQRDEYRFGLTYPLLTGFRIAQRFTLAMVHGPASAHEHGMSTFLDVQYQPRSSSLRIRSRMVWFRSPSYASRTYQYEPDVPGNLSNPPLYGTGLRWFVVASYEPFEQCRFSMKYAEMKRYFETSLGSGDDAIPGNIDGRWALQLDFRL